MKKRIISLFLTVIMLVSCVPTSVFAAHDSVGRPLDLTGDVYLALYTGDNFPGEPAEHDVSGYLNLNSSFGSNGFGKFAESAEGILEEQILDDVVQGTAGVWGVFSTTGGSHYLRQSSGLVTGQDGDPKKPHNAETEKKIIQTAINNRVFTLPAGDSIEDYTIVWYVIKYQRSDSTWHIDGVITKKATYSVNYYGNGNTSGAAPTGTSGLLPEETYQVLANTGNLRKQVGRDTYIFNGWNTATDGTGTHYDAGETITITDHDVTLYAEWYLQNKYTITVATMLDGVEKNVEDFEGENWTVWVKADLPDAGYIELEKTTTGTYTTTVTDNGIYYVYFRDENGTYHEAHGHQVIIYNQNGRTELLNYSVKYDLAGGNWPEGKDPGMAVYHANSHVRATANIPVRDDHVFIGWVDQHNNPVEADGHVTDAILEPVVLTAQWQELVDVTVYVTVNHNEIEDYGEKHDVIFELLRVENGVNMPYQTVMLDEESPNFAFDLETNTTTYTYVFKNLPQAHYHAASAKSHYGVSITYDEFGSITDQIIHIDMTYAPQSFDLDFDVVVNFTEQTKHLRPKAVNVKVSRWNGSEKGWQIIERQADTAAPTTVFIDENGRGTGFFPVWQYWPEEDGSLPFVYRVEVTSFVMPDGSIVAASGTDHVTYVSTKSDLYSAVVTIEPQGAGKIPTYPDSGTALPGAIYAPNMPNEQDGIPTVTIDIAKTYKVTFVAGEGTLNGQETVVLENQYKYPYLHDYEAVPSDPESWFSGWYDAEGNPARDMSGSYLTEDVVYYAHYSEPITLQGTVTIEGTYMQNGMQVTIKEEDRAHEALVVLQKNINGVYNDIGAYLVDFGEKYGDEGSDTYSFKNLPNDGTEYRIQIRVHNYDPLYDNEADADHEYTKHEYTAVLAGDNVAVVDVRLDMAPELYTQMLEVDPTRIQPGFRPDGALAQIIYRNLGDIHHYQVIAQHENDPYIDVPLTNGVGSGSYDIWKYHTDGALYEYQMDIPMFYGNVPGVFAPDGTRYNSDTAPFIIEFGPASRYSAAIDGQARTLTAVLIPKEYEIIFDMGLTAGERVYGMEQYMVDSEDGIERYSYSHTWSEEAQFSAYPYRPGYVFEGWIKNDDGVDVTDGGKITVGAAVAKDLVLTAKWTKLEGTAYTVRHLEMNTEEPLHGAVTVTGAIVGAEVSAEEEKLTIKGYNYAGAKIGDKIYGLNDAPVLTVSEDPTSNVLTIYYLPDGSDGYTDQVESNLKLDKYAVLENNGTYTIRLETFTKDNPITTLIRQDTPMDIVMVLDQSGSIIQKGYLDELKTAVHEFIAHVADHGRVNEVDHRLAIVGYAGDYDEEPTSTNTEDYPIAGGNTTNWVNTGVFDSNGDFHPYTVTGFNYTKYTGTPDKDGTYYALSDNKYLLLTHHDVYYHLVTEEEARLAKLDEIAVYGYAYDENGKGGFVELERNSSGLWLYGDKQLYSQPEFFTKHEDVWTHRDDIAPRQIHGYGVGSDYHSSDDHGDLYVRQETTADNPQLNIYKDALVPVSVGANGSGGLNPGLDSSSRHLGSNGGTYVQYGVEMANRIFEANPIAKGDDRIRVMIMFTDGMPGIGTFDETEANEAIEKAYTTKNTYGAYTYAVGLYEGNEVETLSDQAVFMNALSSNYPNVKEMDEVVRPAGYVEAGSGYLGDGTTYYIQYNNSYYELKYGSVRLNGSWFGQKQTCWYYTRSYVNYSVSTSANPQIVDSMIGSNTIYKYQSTGYVETPHSGYYSTTDKETDLRAYFDAILKEITTKITQEIILHEDTILRDIMGQGLVLTPGSKITAYKQGGSYDKATGEIVWEEGMTQVAQVVIPQNPNGILHSPETTTVQYKLDDGTQVTKENVPFISVYNLNAENATNPDGKNYHPHAVDITGYDFEQWYIKEDHPGYKMIVVIDRIEARDDVQWGRATSTNHQDSGLWLPADEQGKRELLLPFTQPTTIFVERAYVLDYGKEFTLNGWYFDSEEGKPAEAIHVDCNIADGMNYFAKPNTSNSKTGKYGNTLYGNVLVKDDGKVTYTPTTMDWGGYDQFYIFGNTWRKTVVAQDANENGNLWNKVTVIPANNIYYEDSFESSPDTDINGFSGFNFDGDWDFVEADKESQNQEIPEHQENKPYGDVHGWTDSLVDDITFTDNGYHLANKVDEKGKMNASVEFTFTGTGVDVYTRTNADSGIVVAILSSLTENEDGSKSSQIVKMLSMDNLAMSGDYYHIPTVSFENLVYGTYSVKLMAAAAKKADKTLRYEYYVDGVRIYNPLGNTTKYATGVVREAYDLELNPVFTSIRDILLDYDDFNLHMDDDEIGKQGAVFVDWVQDGQQSGEDKIGTGIASYELGTFELYGPKNEVYLSAGQAIVLKVDPKNTYYVGMKSLNGNEVIANVSGINKADPTTIQLSHTTDMYYRVTPVDGYIVIQNGSTDEGKILSLTNLRTTNLQGPAVDGGVQYVAPRRAMRVMNDFTATLNAPEEPAQPELLTPGEQHAQNVQQTAQQLFGDVRGWLEEE